MRSTFKPILLIICLFHSRSCTMFCCAWFTHHRPFQSLTMSVQVSPAVGILIIIVALLFMFLFISWCCRQCSESKRIIVPLISPHDPLYGRQYMTAVDIQTGLPVIVQCISRGSRNLVRVTPVSDSGRRAVNGGSYATIYGSIVHTGPEQNEIIARTPPPPYTAVCVQPTVWLAQKLRRNIVWQTMDIIKFYKKKNPTLEESYFLQTVK